jgi:hypothetical protein
MSYPTGNRTDGALSAVSRTAPNPLEKAGLFQGGERAVFVDSLQSAGRQFHRHETVFLRHPNPFDLEIREESARHHLGDMLPNPALFLGQPASVDHRPAGRLGFCDAANSAHIKTFSNKVGREDAVQAHGGQVISLPASQNQNI